MIIVHCACGEVYKIADDKAGYSLICAKCKRVVDLAAPSKNIPRTAKLGRSKGSILLAVLLVLVALVGYNFNPAHQNLAAGVESKPQTTSNSQPAPLSESLKAPPARSISSAPTHLNSKAYIPTAKEMAEVDRQVSLTPKPQSNLDQVAPHPCPPQTLPAHRYDLLKSATASHALARCRLMDLPLLHFLFMMLTDNKSQPDARCTFFAEAKKSPAQTSRTFRTCGGDCTLSCCRV